MQTFGRREAIAMNPSSISRSSTLTDPNGVWTDLFLKSDLLRSTVKGITTCDELSRHLPFQLCLLA